MIYALILRAGPPQMVRPMYHLVVSGVFIPPHASLASDAHDVPDPEPFLGPSARGLIGGARHSGGHIITVGGEAQDNKRAVWPDGCTVSTSAALLATHNIAEGEVSQSAMTADTKRSRR
jgi:hypothetical protein